MISRSKLSWITLGVAACWLAACQSQPQPVAAGASPAALQAASTSTAVTTAIAGQALVGTVPLANADVVLYDPILNQAPVAPGTGDGVRLEWLKTAVRTDAQGKFSVSLALKPGQVAEVYISDGVQSVCGVLAGPAFAVRNAGKVAVDGSHPLLLDIDSTTTASVMLSSLKALGKAAAKLQAQGPDAVLALQAKAVDVMAGAVGATAAKLAALAGSADIAETIAKHMVQADPRLTDPAAKTSRQLLAAADGSDAVLSAVVAALEESGQITAKAIAAVLAQGSQVLSQALNDALSNDPAAVTFLTNLQTSLQQAAQDDTTTAAGVAAPPTSTTPPGTTTPPATTPDSSQPAGSDGAENIALPPVTPAVTETNVGVVPGAVTDPPATAVTLGSP